MIEIMDSMGTLHLFEQEDIKIDANEVMIRILNKDNMAIAAFPNYIFAKPKQGDRKDV